MVRDTGTYGSMGRYGGALRKVHGNRSRGAGTIMGLNKRHRRELGWIANC
jgi:hypothetical protein